MTTLAPAATDVGSVFATVAFSGPMLLALPVALIAGVVSFASPCVLPLVPGYLGYLGGMSGVTSGEVQQSSHGAGGVAPASFAQLRVPRTPPRGRLLLGVALFIAGFTTIFVAFGTLAGALGASLAGWQDTVTRLLGTVVIVMGLSFMGFVPFLQDDLRPHVTRTAGLWGAPLLGLAFGLGWTPCIGPTLAAVMALSLDGGSAGRGAALSAAYGLGLGLPFVLVAFGFGRSSRLMTVLHRHRLALSRLGGVMLVLVGIALATGLWADWTQTLQGLIAGFETVV